LTCQQPEMLPKQDSLNFSNPFLTLPRHEKNFLSQEIFRANNADFLSTLQINMLILSTNTKDKTRRTAFLQKGLHKEFGSCALTLTLMENQF
jgi:hypothetical protein